MSSTNKTLRDYFSRGSFFVMGGVLVMSALYLCIQISKGTPKNDLNVVQKLNRLKRPEDAQTYVTNFATIDVFGVSMNHDTVLFETPGTLFDHRGSIKCMTSEGWWGTTAYDWHPAKGEGQLITKAAEKVLDKRCQAKAKEMTTLIPDDAITP